MTKIDIVPKHSIQSQPRPSSQRDKEARPKPQASRGGQEKKCKQVKEGEGSGPEGPQKFLYQDVFERHLSQEE